MEGSTTDIFIVVHIPPNRFVETRNFASLHDGAQTRNLVFLHDGAQTRNLLKDAEFTRKTQNLPGRRRIYPEDAEFTRKTRNFASLHCERYRYPKPIWDDHHDETTI